MVVPFVFPWYLAITQAWVRPVIQIADLTGPLGVSFLLVLVNGAIYDASRAGARTSACRSAHRRRRCCIVSLALGYGHVRIHQVETARDTAPKLKVGVVQANIGINEKWRPPAGACSSSPCTSSARARLKRSGAELMVWPESSYPYYFARDQPHDWPIDDAPPGAQARLHDAAPVRRAHRRGATAALSLQLGAAARPRRRRCAAASTRTSSWCSASTSPTSSR